ncbi:MAG: hypothetical protein KKA90_04220 [Nanoarchaeota archaeon]|nr:hypothetical protein [Nanoarchaeota archaeon]
MRRTKREIVEELLIKKFESVRPMNPEETEVIESFKDGSFGVSTLAFSLYSNGHNLRGKNSKCPYGLIFEDGKRLFSIGYYRKETDTEEDDGYLFIVAPRGKGVIEKIDSFTDAILADKNIPSKGVYVRFLCLNQYLRLLLRGFLPPKESPWHPEAQEEDETYNNAVINIERIITTSESGDLKINLISNLNRRSRKRVRLDYNRFDNFLARSGLEFTLKEYSEDDFNSALSIIKNHFEILKKKDKGIGSTPEDYLNIVNLCSMTGITAYIGYLGKQPVSLFVGELLNNERLGLYASFTLRDPDFVLKNLKERSNISGFTAMPLYAYLMFFKEVRTKGIKEVHLGGSEHPDLNRFKRQLGAKKESSYWVVKLKIDS